MITDKVSETMLKFITNTGNPTSTRPTSEIMKLMATELLSLRSQKARLIEDGERLLPFVYHDGGCDTWMNGGDFGDGNFPCTCIVEEVRTQHAALLKELEEEKNENTRTG